ncbi:MAG: glutaredoxin domain-containing protein [Burkholderiales bacterium]
MTRTLLVVLALVAAGTAAAQGIYREVNPAPAVPRTQAAAGLVVMYATSWCPYCAKARAYFGRKGIAYTEYDVEKSPTANAEFKRLGGRGVPLILVGREKMSGFSEAGFDALLARASR